jgi:hypothetical protein
VIGIIFFGLLGSQSAPASAAVAPQLRSGLAAASVPAPVAASIEARFGGCLHARLVATDPTVTPAACQLPGHQSLPGQVRMVLADAGTTAVRHDFAAALERTLWFQVAVFLASFLLMTVLPRGAGRRSAGNAQTGPLADRPAAEGVVIG